MDNFDPERSGREMRKLNRRIYRERQVPAFLPFFCSMIFIWDNKS